MAFMVAQNGVIALYQGAAETGPRALGHRSIFANPCDPEARERLNERVKYREAIRPLAPMATLEAAQEYFELNAGASDGNYNAYNYMVLTAHSKPQARSKIPAVVHADGTGRIQIVREEDDPLTYAYLKALGRRIGVEISVNTSFNVAGPIAQTPNQAIDTLRRSKGLDAVLLGERAIAAGLAGGIRNGSASTSRHSQPHLREHMKNFSKVLTSAKTAAIAGFALVVTGIDASAAEVRFLCADALESSMQELIPEFEKTNGHSVKMILANAGVNTERVRKGDVVDLAIVLPQQWETLRQEGKSILPCE
jgi:hypothetical protein